ncbi:MAG: hypothetical protein IPJ13_02005 [Saprospiraceae bacterium]|nr:hypothetical protein [Saprospiraceae bacterium]
MWRGQKLSFSQPAAFQLTINFPTLLNKGSRIVSLLHIRSAAIRRICSFIQSSRAGSLLCGRFPSLWISGLVALENGLDDKIDSIDVIVTTAEKYRAASNGSLISEKSVAGGV